MKTSVLYMPVISALRKGENAGLWSLLVSNLTYQCAPGSVRDTVCKSYEEESIVKDI